jgi:hypothetical protein
MHQTLHTCASLSNYWTTKSLQEGGLHNYGRGQQESNATPSFQVPFELRPVTYPPFDNSPWPTAPFLHWDLHLPVAATLTANMAENEALNLRKIASVDQSEEDSASSLTTNVTISKDNTDISVEPALLAIKRGKLGTRLAQFPSD